jgi:hypothetical protein
MYVQRKGGRNDGRKENPVRKLSGRMRKKRRKRTMRRSQVCAPTLKMFNS